MSATSPQWPSSPLCSLHAAASRGGCNSIRFACPHQPAQVWPLFLICRLSYIMCCPLLYHFLPTVVSYFSARDCIILFCPPLYHTFLAAVVSYFSARCCIILFCPLLYHIFLPVVVSYLSVHCCIIFVCPPLYHTFLAAVVSYFSDRHCIIPFCPLLYHTFPPAQRVCRQSGFRGTLLKTPCATKMSYFLPGKTLCATKTSKVVFYQARFFFPPLYHTFLPAVVSYI